MKEYSKLVRDKIPEIILGNGQKPNTRIATIEEYSVKLSQKLKEEVDEYLEEETVDELADVLEVIYAILDHKNVSKDELEKLRKNKYDERGGFSQRIILDTAE